MAMQSTHPKATGSSNDNALEPQSKTDDLLLSNNTNTGRTSSSSSSVHGSSSSTPRIIFDFRSPPPSCSRNGSGRSNENGTSRSSHGRSTDTKARRKVSPTTSNILYPHVIKWTPVPPPLPSSWKPSTSNSNNSILSHSHCHNHKRVHDKNNESLRNTYTSTKKQRLQSSSSMLPQPLRTTRCALYHLLLFTLLSFIAIPTLLSFCIHRGVCANVEQNFVLSQQTTVHESACHVISIAIIHILHHLPKDAHSLLLKMHHFIGTIITEGDGMTMTIHESDDDWKRKLWQRVTADHAKKHHARSTSSSSSSSASEEINRIHPLRHILEGASIYTHVRKQKLEEKKKKKEQHNLLHDEYYHDNNLDGTTMIDWNKWKYAMSDDYELSLEEITMVQTLAQRVLTMANTIVRCTTDDDDEDTNTFSTNCNSLEEDETIRRRVIYSLSKGSDMPYRPFHERVDSVAWGGGMKNNHTDDMLSWWPKQQSTKDPSSSSSSSTTIISSHSEGGRLLAGYLKIMKWPSDLHVKFPFRLCASGCDSEVAVLHTLEWREKYKPWCVSEETIRFNKDGFIYTRGHSRPGSKQRFLDATEQTVSLPLARGHSMVWLRPSLASPTDNPHQYGRSLIHAVEMAVSDSLERNAGTIGRFNVVVDCANMSSKNSPSIAGVKTVFSILQDHFPDRLGVLLLANLSGLTQLLLKMVLPFVTEDVRAKIHIIPNDEEERREMLLQFIDETHIPYYLGGKDEYEFDAEGYYQGNCILPEDGIMEYVTTMPYHA